MSTTDGHSDKKLKDIALILRDLLKVIKIVSMYPEGNPLPENLKRSFAERLVYIIDTYGQIDLQVEKGMLCMRGEVLFTDRDEEALAAIFFDSGITGLTFKTGLEELEIYRFLDAIKEYQNAPRDNRDLVANLWEAGLARITLATVEDVSLQNYDITPHVQEICSDSQVSRAGGEAIFGTDESEGYESIFVADDELDQSGDIELPDDDALVEGLAGQPGRPGGLPGPQGGGAVRRMTRQEAIFYARAARAEQAESVLDDGLDEISLQVGAAAEAMGLSDLKPASGPPAIDTTMILNDEFELSNEEKEKVTSILTDDAAFDIYESTLQLIKELLLQESELNAFMETVTISEKVCNEFVRSGHLFEAGQLLEYLADLEGRLNVERPQWAKRLKEAILGAGSREGMKRLTTALSEYPDTGVADLRRYLDSFNWEVIDAVVDALGNVSSERHREVFGDFLVQRGSSKIPLISKGLYDKRGYVVRNAVLALGQIGSDEALHHLAKVVKHEEQLVRRAMVTSLDDCPHDGALELLRQLVYDSDAEVRRQAVSSIGRRSGPAAFDTIAGVLNDDRLDLLDPDDRQLLLITYARLGGDQAVEYLERLITRVSLVGNETASFYRHAAFEALANNRSERAERLLVKLTGSWRREIKHLANEALHRRRQLMYGGDDDDRNS